MTRIRQRSARGFSILELIIVMAIILAVAAIAIPRVVTASQDYRLRSTASSLSGVIQKGRMMSVARNGFYAVRFVTTSNAQYAYVDEPVAGTTAGNGQLDATENTNVLVPAGIVFDSSGGGLSLSTMGLSFTPVIGLPQFNPRGLPCFFPSGSTVCQVSGFIYYLRQDRAVGDTGWAAVTVTPAGRVRVWTWDGSRWQ